MKDDLGLSNTDMSELLVLRAAAFCQGKLFNGLLADTFDVRYVLLFLMTMSMIACFGWGLMNDKYSMFPFIFVNCYCQSGVNLCMVKLIYSWFDADAYKQTFSMLYLASQGGAFINLLIMGIIVAATNWRWTVRLVSLMTGLGIIFSVCMMRDRSAPSTRNDHCSITGKKQRSGCQPLCKLIYRSPQFWFCLLVAGLMKILHGIESYMALWLTDIFRPCTYTNGNNCDSAFNSGHAAIVTSLQPLGVILSLIFGQIFLHDVHPKKEAKANVLFLSGVTFSALALSLLTTFIESGTRPKKNPWYWVGPIAVLILFYGFCLGYPTVIPPNVYCAKVGGMNAAKLKSIIDITGWFLLSIFWWFGTSLSETEGVSETARSTWRYDFYLLVAIALLSTIAMFGFQYYNLRPLKNWNLFKRVSIIMVRKQSSMLEKRRNVEY